MSRLSENANRESACLIILRRAVWDDVYAMAALVEENLTIDERKKRPVAPGADILASDKFCPALPHEDAAGGDMLATESLHA